MDNNSIIPALVLIIIACSVFISIVFLFVKLFNPSKLKSVTFSKMTFGILFLIIISFAIHYLNTNNSIFYVSTDSSIQKMAYLEIQQLEMRTNNVRLSELKEKFNEYEIEYRNILDSLLLSTKDDETAIYESNLLDSLLSNEHIDINLFESALSMEFNKFYLQEIEKLFRLLPTNPLIDFNNQLELIDPKYDNDIWYKDYEKILFSVLKNYEPNRDLIYASKTNPDFKIVLNDVFSIRQFNSFVKELHSELLKNLEFNLSILNNKYSDLEHDLMKLEDLKKDAIKINQSQTNDLLIKVIVPIFALLLIAILFLPWVYRDKVEITNALFKDKLLLQSFTVFILVITIIMLALGNKLTEQALGTLLGGISVFVLQQTLGKNSHNP